MPGKVWKIESRRDGRKNAFRADTGGLHLAEN
jgi:hypothetical protein